jgi:hypothetical protein
MSSEAQPGPSEAQPGPSEARPGPSSNKIKSNLMDIFPIIFVIFYIPNSLHKNCMTQYKEIL